VDTGATDASAPENIMHRSGSTTRVCVTHRVGNNVKQFRVARISDINPGMARGM
jgi:hypothetical protein